MAHAIRLKQDSIANVQNVQLRSWNGMKEESLRLP